MTNSSSCFEEKLGHYIELTEQDRSLLAVLEETTETFKAGENVVTDGETEGLFVVKRGRLFAYSNLADGRRHVFQLYYPGDIVGFNELPFEYSPIDVKCAIQSCLCPFPKSALATIFRESPKLTSLMFSLSLVDNTIIVDRLRVLGRMDARERVAHLLLEIHSRLKITNPAMQWTFDLPLDQATMGDMLGLTNVSISRSISRLENDGVIVRHGRNIELVKDEELCTMTQFQNRFEQLQTDWLTRKF